MSLGFSTWRLEDGNKTEENKAIKKAIILYSIIIVFCLINVIIAFALILPKLLEGAQGKVSIVDGK